MKLTENFSLEELCKSATADKLKINNTPNANEKLKLLFLCKTILQPIREKYGKPIIVSSGFRCKTLNTAIGGSKTSQHMKGEAADIHSVTDTKEDNKILFDLIKGMIDKGEIKVGQLIDEYNYDWIHVSIPYSKVNQILHLK